MAIVGAEGSEEQAEVDLPRGERAEPGHSRSSSARNSSGREPLGALVRGMAELDEGAAGALADLGTPAAGELERAGEGLAAVGERVAHEGAQRRFGRRARPAEADEHRVDVRHGTEHGPAHAPQHAHLARELGEDRGDAVVAASGRRGEPLTDLALDHRDPPRDRRQLLDRPQDHRCGDAVRKVGDELRRWWTQRGEIELDGVAEVQRDVGGLTDGGGEPWAQTLVDLDDVDVAGPRREPLGEDPWTAADLEDDVGRIELREALDDPEDVAVDEEVLTELAVARTGHHPSTAAALRSIAASSSA